MRMEVQRVVTWRLLAVLLVVAFIAAVPGAAEPLWRARFDALLAQPGKARPAFDYLQGLPLAVKKTAEFHVALARAARAIEDPLWAARSVMVVTLILDAGSPAELSDVKRWLASKGLELHRLSLELLAKGDEVGAAKRYLGAVRCDSAVLGFADRGLRDRALSVLDQSIQFHADDAEYWGQLAFYNYFFDRVDSAKSALEKALGLAKEPYMRWLYDEGLRAIERKRTPRAVDDPVAVEYARERERQIREELVRREAALSPAPAGGHTLRSSLGVVAQELAQQKKVIQQLTSELKLVVISSNRSGFR